MKTLIELYDERPLENVLSTEMFRPERTVFVCPPDVAADQPLQNAMREYFRHRGVRCELIFVAASLLDAAAVERKLREITERWPDCALDIAGGTDAALFAGGLLCAVRDVPVFTYSRKRNTFFNIQSAPFADSLPCQVRLNVEDCFLMAGGSMRPGQTNGAVPARYLSYIDPFFAIYLRYRRHWPRIVTYIQRISQKESGLEAHGGLSAKGEHGGRVSAPLDALRDFQAVGMIHDLEQEGENVSFRFADAQMRAWLRSVGLVLELYIYKTCLDLGVFGDVRTGVVVDWLGEKASHDSVVNELDVVATAGVRPVFISCKTCDVKTEALNELAILRDHFGGQFARAAIVTAEHGRSPMRHRAMELGIDVIDLPDISSPDSLRERLKALLR